MKKVGLGLAAFAGVIAVFFILGVTGLGFDKFFRVRQENIRREAFEETQSFVHGKTQELARMFEQYNSADLKGKEQLRVLISIQFADFDETNIRSRVLRKFLIEMRRY